MGKGHPRTAGYLRKRRGQYRRLCQLIEVNVSQYPMNKDLNSGDPLGMGVAPNSAYRGWRTTAADLLLGAPKNLVIQTNVVVDRVVIRNKSAIGVEANGTQCKLRLGFRGGGNSRSYYLTISTRLCFQRCDLVSRFLGQPQDPHALRNRPCG
jgi:hypothetical protein